MECEEPPEFIETDAKVILNDYVYFWFYFKLGASELLACDRVTD